MKSIAKFKEEIRQRQILRQLHIININEERLRKEMNRKTYLKTYYDDYYLRNKRSKNKMKTFI